MKINKLFYCIVSILLLFIISCTTYHYHNITEDYTGYIIDSVTRKSVVGVYVKDILSGKDTFTDSSGYFSIPFSKDRDDALLFFYKDKFANDTIYSDVTFSQAGECFDTYRLFVGDTIDLFHYKPNYTK